jgi:hypothetical protein
VQPADPSTDAEATAAGIAEIAVMTTRRGRPAAVGDPAGTGSLTGAGGLLTGTIYTPGAAGRARHFWFVARRLGKS